MSDPYDPYLVDPLGLLGGTPDPNAVLFDFAAAAKAEAECQDAATVLQSAIDRLGDLDLEVWWTGTSADTHRRQLDSEIQVLRAARQQVLATADTLAAATLQARRDEGSSLLFPPQPAWPYGR